MQQVPLAGCLTLMALCFNRVLIAELDVAMGLVGLPSNYAKDTERQGRLAVGSEFNCYRSTPLPIPLPLFYGEFEDFCLRCASTAEISLRTSLFTLEWCNEMQYFASKDIKRELAFAKLIREYLTGHLSDVLTLTHQTRGESIIDIRLQVKVCANNKGRMHMCNEPVKSCVLHHRKLIAMLSITLIDLRTHLERCGCRWQSILSP